MSVAKSQRIVRAGYGGNSCFLSIEDVIFEDKTRNLDYSVEEVANFSLRYLPDTNEVALIKGDEIVYSELLS